MNNYFEVIKNRMTTKLVSYRIFDLHNRIYYITYHLNFDQHRLYQFFKEF